MKKTILLLCVVLIPATAFPRVHVWPSNKRLPALLKTPDTCEVIKINKFKTGKSYRLWCKRRLSKRMPGWVFDYESYSKDRHHRTRLWFSRRGRWVMEETSHCKISNCTAFSIIIYQISTCQVNKRSYGSIHDGGVNCQKKSSTQH